MNLAPATSSRLSAVVLIYKVFHIKFLFFGEQSARRELGTHLGLANNIGNQKKEKMETLGYNSLLLLSNKYVIMFLFAS